MSHKIKRQPVPPEPESDSEEEEFGDDAANEDFQFDDSGEDQDVDSAEDDQHEENEEWETEPDAGPKREETQLPVENILSRIKNKLRRRKMFEKMLEDKRKSKLKQKRRKAKSEVTDEPKPEPRTIENTCGFSETLPETESPEEDPFNCYFNREKNPKIIVTTVEHPRSKTMRFCREFARTFPNTEFRFRRNCSIKGTMKAAAERGYTHLIVVNQDQRRPNGLLVIHLPDGPTANFKLSSVKYHRDIRNKGQHSRHRPEVIVNNFHTRLGQTVGRLFASLCHFDPQFKGRRVVTFHNQRDYIFFRHHRYQFKNNQRVALQEIGPRFTLRLRWFQKGPFDTKSEQFDWVYKREEKTAGKHMFYL